jgi:DNA-directed RNA polymerase specialized sigma24 family protein
MYANAFWANLHDAEDAFQASFLVLARKAASVHPRESLTAWLHEVAHRVALKARSARFRRLREVHKLREPGAHKRPDPLADVWARELFALVDTAFSTLAVTSARRYGVAIEAKISKTRHKHIMERFLVCELPNGRRSGWVEA